MSKTYSAKPLEVERKWYVIDAAQCTEAGIPLGRIASLIAYLIRGKHKPQFTPHIDTGDFVIVINAEKTYVSGKKNVQKKYSRHSGYPGGFKQEQFKALQARRPERVIELAVQGMLPHNRLGRRLFHKLFVYPGAEHPHAAQQPQVYDISKILSKEAV